MYGRNGVINQRKMVTNSKNRMSRHGRYDKHRQDGRHVGNHTGSTQREIRTTDYTVPVSRSHSATQVQQSQDYREHPRRQVEHSHDQRDGCEFDGKHTISIHQDAKQSREKNLGRSRQSKQVYNNTSDRFPRRSKSESRVTPNYPTFSSSNFRDRRNRAPVRTSSALGEHAFDEVDYEMSRPTGGIKDNTEPFLGDRKFLRKVQHELEEQRAEWKNEVDRIGGLSGTGINVMSSNRGQIKGQGSYVDESSGSPIFKAFIDVRDYPSRSVSVNIDKLENKIIVKASRSGSSGQPDRTFIQKVKLPKFADDRHVTSGLNEEGLLVINVPLIYYFHPEQKSAKAFINEVKTHRCTL